LFPVPEIPVYGVHGADGRNAPQDSLGGEVMVDPRAGLVDFGVSTETGVAVPGLLVPMSPQDVSSVPTNMRGTMEGHNRGWLRCIRLSPNVRCRIRLAGALSIPPVHSFVKVKVCPESAP